MKGYTDLEQSKKLKEILPIESADMYYHYNRGVVNDYHEDVPEWVHLNNHFVFFGDDIPCWSLAALVGILPKIHGLKPVLDLEENSIQYSGIDIYIVADNPVDACYETIVKLNELKML